MRHLLALALVLSACGSGSRVPPTSAVPPPSGPAEAPVEAQAAAPAAAPPASPSIPSSCASSEGLCVPEAAFVKRMCGGSFPDVALVLMGKDAPFTRMYMKGDVDGWNADGGASARARLHFDEEVLVLRKREAPKNGIVVGAGGGYLVMRWDGNCYTLEENELSSRKPPAAKHAPMAWRFFGERTKEALLKSAKVLAAYQRRGKECKGAVSGEVSRACEQADAALSAAIVSEVRGGLAIPTPERLP